MLPRRTFLATLAAALPLASLVRRAHAAAVTELADDARTLHALGQVVLPAALGADGVVRAVDDFRRWLAGWREGVELIHGYGTSALAISGPTPAMRWTAQLVALDRQARRTSGGRAFIDLPLADRRALVERALGEATGASLGDPARAPHVAVALLAHWAATPAAHDLAYQARIGREQCRPLAEQARKPLALPLARV